MKVGYVYAPVYLEHDTGQHPETAARLEAVMSRLEESGLKKELYHIPPRPATIEELALVHREEYIAYVEAVAESGGGWLDADTVASPGSYRAALYAAGGAIRATEVVMNEGASLDKKIQNRINEVIDTELANIEDFCEKLTYGKISVW